MQHIEARILKLPASFVIPLLFLILQGCATLKLQSPSVTVADIRVTEANLFEQRYAIKLRVMNPNDVDIPVTGMNFAIDLNDQPFARGVSNRLMNVPRLSETVVEVSTVSDLSGLIRQIHELGRGDRRDLSYVIRGRLICRSLPDLDFENRGTIRLPDIREDGQGF